MAHIHAPNVRHRGSWICPRERVKPMVRRSGDPTTCHGPDSVSLQAQITGRIGPIHDQGVLCEPFRKDHRITISRTHQVRTVGCVVREPAAVFAHIHQLAQVNDAKVFHHISQRSPFPIADVCAPRNQVLKTRRRVRRQIRLLLA